MLALVTSCGAASRPTEPPATPNNPEIQAIVAADQADRESSIAAIDWTAVQPRDAARRKRVLELIENGDVRTGNDFASAALVFQHGDTSNDILLAHVLAVTALGKGNPDGRRMAAITLDRYLTRIGQAQVFGTQFNSAKPNDPNAWTMDPYDPKLLGDQLRVLNCVEASGVQSQLLAAMKRGEDIDPPPVCP